MSAPDTRRCIWLTPEDGRKLFRIAINLDDDEQADYVRSLGHLVANAPADPAEAVASALWEDGQAMPQGLDETVAEILAALGCVPARETNEKPA